MDLAQTNKILLLMKPFLIMLAYSAYMLLRHRYVLRVLMSSSLVFYACKIESLTAFLIGVIGQIPQTIEIVDAGKSTIELIIYVLSGLATIFGLIKGFGWLKSNREKKKSIIEENTEMLNHIQDMTSRVQSAQSEVLSISTKSHAEIMRLTHAVSDRDMTIINFKSKCNNNCNEK